MLTKQKALQRITLWQTAGFVSLIAVILFDEVFNLSNIIFQQPKRDFNWVEALTEVYLAALLGLLVVGHTLRLIKRIRYLEGFISLCSFCKKVRVEDEWVPLESYLSSRSELQFSHGFCPLCTEKHYGEFLARGKGGRRGKRSAEGSGK